jgi:plastocyanin domain-containing protein
MRTFFVLAVLAVLAACKKDEAPVARAEQATIAEKAPRGAPRVITLEVTADGFKPENLTLKANEPVRFVVTRTTDETCATDLLIEGTDIKLALPLNAQVEVAWTPTRAGRVKFGCAMDYMVGGVLVVE